MKAEIVLLNPELAKRLLKKNVGNRDLKNRCYNSYINPNEKRIMERKRRAYNNR